MAIYTAGRRRTMIILLLTSVLLITLDLRGNAVFNGIRSGFEYAFRPFEIAGDVVTRPVARVWRGVTEVDDLREEVERQQEIIDRQRQAEIAGNNALVENQELRALLDLEGLSDFDSVTGGIIGSSPSNFDQRVEIDKGSVDGLHTGMPVVNSAGLVGKVTQVFPTTAIVMLVTDPQYAVPVKIIGQPPSETDSSVPESTVPSGLPVEDAPEGVATTTTSTTSTSTTTSTTTTSTSTTTTSTTLPGQSVTPPTTPTPTSSTSTTTTTTIPDIPRETGALEGMGAGRLPRVRFIVDSPQFGRIQVGDSVLTAGGSKSLAPPNIPVGRVAKIITNPGTRGTELEIELNADLERLNFMTVVLYLSPEEASTVR